MLLPYSKIITHPRYHSAFFTSYMSSPTSPLNNLQLYLCYNPYKSLILLTDFLLFHFFLALCLSKSCLPIEYKGKVICYCWAKNINKYIYVLFSQLETLTIFSLTKNISKKQ